MRFQLSELFQMQAKNTFANLCHKHSQKHVYFAVVNQKKK